MWKNVLWVGCVLAICLGDAWSQTKPTGVGRLSVEWIGQDGSDKVGPSPRLEPSDVQDIHLILKGLPIDRVITQLEVSGDGGDLWRFGGSPGPFAASVERSDNSPQADIYLEPSRVERGRGFALKIRYSDNSTADLTFRGGRADPMVRVADAKLSGRWVGATDADILGSTRAPGPDGVKDAIIELTGLSRRSPIQTVLLLELKGGRWSQGPTKLAGNRAELNRSGDAKVAPLHFQPETDPNGKTFLVELTYANQYQDRAIVRGGKYPRKLTNLVPIPNPSGEDVSVKALPPTQDSIANTPAREVKPGENLVAILETNDHLVLKQGLHRLDAPLVLSRPLVIEAEPNTTLQFRQPPTDPAWTSAIEIRASRVRLKGFALRIEGPIRWNEEVSYGPALIGGPVQGNDRASDLELDSLDLRSPIPTSKTWPEAVRLARLFRIVGGSIHDCTLQGGIIEFTGGPWTITDNRHEGSVDGAQTSSAFSGHAADRLILKGNQVEPRGTGKLWRFLVLTRSGDGIQVANNVIRGVGPAKSDQVPHPNAPETILTESYRIHYEGEIAGLSEDGRALAIHQPQGTPVGVGAIVALLDGPEAGRWRRVLRVDGPTLFKLDAPIPSSTHSISITTGFVDLAIVGNTLDSRGHDQAVPLVLVGNHFGTKIEGNVFTGAVEPFRLSAAPTEEPVRWGWTHAPFLGVRLTNNRLEDCVREGTIVVDHSDAVEPGAGRVYLTLEAKGNRTMWSKPSREAREALRIGVKGGLDPGELLYFDKDNTTTAPNRIDIFNATVNGVKVPSKSFSWPVVTKSGSL